MMLDTIAIITRITDAFVAFFEIIKKAKDWLITTLSQTLHLPPGALELLVYSIILFGLYATADSFKKLFKILGFIALGLFILKIALWLIQGGGV